MTLRTPCTVALFALVACGAPAADDDGTIDTDSPVTDTDTDADSDSDSDAPVAAAVVGPAGATLTTAAFDFIVPAGALDTEEAITIHLSDVTPAAATLYSPVLELGPAGLTFDPPSAIRFPVPEGVTEVAIFLSQAHDPTVFQQIDALVVDGIAQARVPHFSSVYMCDPNTPGVSGWFCCEPLDPLTTPDSDCVLNPSNGVSCDPDICSVTPGACPTPPPPSNPCDCAPIDPTTTTPADCLMNPANGVTCDPDLCAVPASCAPPADFCTACDDPGVTSHPVFAQNYPLSLDAWTQHTCDELAALAPNLPPPPVAGDPSYFALMSRLCAFDQALADLGCTSGPTTIPSQCDPADTCTDLDLCLPIDPTASPLYLCLGETAATCGVGNDCQLVQTCCDSAQACVPIDPTMHTLADCLSNPSNGVVCDPDICQPDPSCDPAVGQGGGTPGGGTPGGGTPGGGPASPCDVCQDRSVTSTAQYQQAFSQSSTSFAALTCDQLVQSTVSAPSAPPTDPSHPLQAARYCAWNQAFDNAQCGSQGYADSCP